MPFDNIFMAFNVILTYMARPEHSDDVQIPANSPWLLQTPGSLFGLLRQQDASGLAKSEVAAATGLSRTAVSQRIDALVAAGLLVPVTAANPSRGRPAERYTLNLDYGAFLVADTGATGMRTALCDPAGTILADHHERLDITAGPTAVLDLVSTRFDALLDEAGMAKERILGIGLSLPGPVAHDRGRVISPPIMTGWHDFDIPGYFAVDYACPVIVENDVNAMALGEHRRVHPGVDDLVFVKLGTGLGAGLLLAGQLFRGADGAAGDIGHIPLGDPGPDAPLCRCGKYGCVEAYAGGWAIMRDLTEAGLELETLDDLVNAVRSGDRLALKHVREAAGIVGAAVADLVNTINPRIIVFGGQLAALDDILLAQVREVIYGRSPVLATQRLTITSSVLDGPGVLGLAALVADHVFAPANIDHALATSAT